MLTLKTFISVLIISVSTVLHSIIHLAGVTTHTLNTNELERDIFYYNIEVTLSPFSL